jgi:prepilin-type processing-associated H-X9-DG protein
MRSSSSSPFRLIDLLVGMLVVLFAAAVVLSKAPAANEIKLRIQCASNLRQIGQALLLYSNENRGSFPRTIHDKKDPNPTPVWGTPYEGNRDLGPVKDADPFAKDKDAAAKARPLPEDVSAALFLLLRTQAITSEVFICPSTQHRKFNFGGGMNTSRNWTNWPGNLGLLANLSYSVHSPYASPAAVKAGAKWNNAMPADAPIAGDMNPGVDGLLKLTLQSPADEMRKCNSINHNQDGQNVLYGDGHVEFQSQPFCGVKRDNLYTYGATGTDHPNTGGDGIAGSPVGPEDAVLLPTSTSLGDTNPLLTPEGL